MTEVHNIATEADNIYTPHYTIEENRLIYNADEMKLKNIYFQTHIITVLIYIKCS